jgi:hypothetical protein
MLSPVIDRRSRLRFNNRFLYRHIDLLGDRRPNVHAFCLGFYTNNQSVARAEFATIALGLILPPP